NYQNAHPHSNGQVAVVHNGIIENAGKLKNNLKLSGFEFKSDEDSDSEVFLGLITMEMAKGLDLKRAMINSFLKIEGNSAFVVQNKDSDEIYAVKRGNPLVCGVREDTEEISVSSDPYALMGMANKVYFPDDMTLCCLQKDMGLRFFDMDGNESKKYQIRRQNMNLTPAKKGTYEHFMLKEIYEQPELVRSLRDFYSTGEGRLCLQRIQEITPDRVYIIACGTAYFAGLCIRNYLESLSAIPCVVEFASEFRYKKSLFKKGDVALFISQSGETADTLAAQKLCKENGLKTLSIVNVEGSTLFRDCDANLPICAGTEIGVASTKAFSLMVLVGRLLAQAWKDKSDVDLYKQFDVLADRMEVLLTDADSIKSIAENLYQHKAFFYTGRGQYYPIALEGALKLKEIAYVHAEGYAAGELKHGPIALIEKQVVNMAIIGPELFHKAFSNMQEIKARRGIIVGIGPRGNEDMQRESDFYIPLDFTNLDGLSPVYVNVVGQLFAYYLAYFKGTDIDRPRNLAKSVTVE
ncbi:MAG: glutamine--fructose-6-phosphate transaminase (isomerizing), partial [Halobacteriovoraceae bacterium]|nr:glutamine--fructose-6-phosphate transaminase (isomerizing) [Halobacteriovoraceae bacterium]